MKRFLFLLILLAIPFQAKAQWRPEELKIADSFVSPNTRNDAQGAEAYMLWSLMTAGEDKLDSASIGGLVELKGSSSLDRPMPVYLALQKNSNGSIKNAPMVVWVSGFYSDHRSRLDSAVRLYQRGYHVIKFPTAWTRVYLGLGMKFKLGDFREEARALLESLEPLAKKLKARGRVSKIHFLGESYGALIGSHLSSLDQAKNPVFDGDFVLSGPEASILFAMNQFDSYFQGGKEHLDNPFEKLFLAKVARAYTRAKTFAELREEEINHARVIIAYGAHKSLYDLLSWADPKFEKFVKKHFSSKYDFGYSEYLKRYAPKLEEEYSGINGDVPSIYRRVRGTRPGRVKILTSKDDMFNKPNAWKGVEGEIMFLEKGSHFGFLSGGWYTNEFLPAVFPSVKN